MGERLWIVAHISVKAMSLMVISPVFWMTLWVTYCYYKKYEWKEAGARRLALASSMEGLGAGFIVIWLTAFFGLTIKPGPALYWMGPAALGLSLIRPRFLCLSYGAGVVFLISWMLGITVDITAICSLVGLLHLAEGMLVLLVGGKHTVPVYRSKQASLQRSNGIYRFWPVPICLLIAVGDGGGTTSMPGWWPIVSTATLSYQQSFGLLPLAVTLGYSDLAEQRDEVERRRWLKGSLILVYAVLLLGLSIWCTRGAGMSYHSILQWAAPLWMVVGHEVIVGCPRPTAQTASKFIHKNKLETHTGSVYNKLR